MTKYRFWSIVVIACSIWAAFFVFNGAPFKLGLDLSGGTHLVYRADTSGVDSGDIESAMTSLRDTIERRVNLFGVAEPIVQVEQGGAFEGEKEQRLIVELPGVTDVDEAVKKIGETPILEFKLLNQDSGEFVSTGLSGSRLERAELRFDSNQIGSAPIVGLKFNSEGQVLFSQITRENPGKVLGIFLVGQPLCIR